MSTEFKKEDVHEKHEKDTEFSFFFSASPRLCGYFVYFPLGFTNGSNFKGALLIQCHASKV